VDSLVSREKSLGELLTDDRLRGGELLGHFGLRPYNQGSQAVSAITTLLSKPKSFRNELALVLEKFWQSVFQRDWGALEPGLRAESFRMRDIREERSVGDLGRELNLPVAFDDEAREIRPKTGSPISYDLVDRCYVIPSAFNARRWWTKYESSSRRITLYLPITTDSRAPNAIAEESREVGISRARRYDTVRHRLDSCARAYDFRGPRPESQGLQADDNPPRACAPVSRVDSGDAGRWVNQALPEPRYCRCTVRSGGGAVVLIDRRPGTGYDPEAPKQLGAAATPALLALESGPVQPGDRPKRIF
jgi:hypothetical protein